MAKMKASDLGEVQVILSKRVSLQKRFTEFCDLWADMAFGLPDGQGTVEVSFDLRQGHRCGASVKLPMKRDFIDGLKERFDNEMQTATMKLRRLGVEDDVNDGESR